MAPKQYPESVVPGGPGPGSLPHRMPGVIPVSPEFSLLIMTLQQADPNFHMAVSVGGSELFVFHEDEGSEPIALFFDEEDGERLLVIGSNDPTKALSDRVSAVIDQMPETSDHQKGDAGE